MTAKCKIQNAKFRMIVSAKRTYLKSFPEEIPSFCILHSAFCIRPAGRVNYNLSFQHFRLQLQAVLSHRLFFRLFVSITAYFFVHFCIKAQKFVDKSVGWRYDYTVVMCEFFRNF